MKECFKCGAIKALHDFYKHPRAADGHVNKCKECTKMDVRKRRAEKDSVREYDRRRYQEPKRKSASAENVRSWRLKNPDGYRAHYLLSNAVRDGRIKREPCGICGEIKSHAHHDDYMKPLSVRWLCALHHHRFHAEEKSKGLEK